MGEGTYFPFRRRITFNGDESQARLNCRLKIVSWFQNIKYPSLKLWIHWIHPLPQYSISSWILLAMIHSTRIEKYGSIYCYSSSWPKKQIDRQQNSYKVRCLACLKSRWDGVKKEKVKPSPPAIPCHATPNWNNNEDNTRTFYES